MTKADDAKGKIDEPEDNAPVVDEPESPEVPVDEPENQNPEAPEEPENPKEPEQPEEDPKEDPKPSRRESLRIQKLVEKLKEKKTQPEPLDLGGIDYEKALEADPETIKKLKEDRQAVADAQYNRGIEQAKSIQFHTRLDIDAPRVHAKYSQLDPENTENFNPALADAVSMMYLSTVGYNPNSDTVQNTDVRYADYVDSIFELASEIAGDQTQRTTRNVAKQAAQTGLRPDGSSVKMNLGKAPGDMTPEELDAAIAQFIPQAK